MYPEKESILAVFPWQKVELYKGADQLPILSGTELELTVDIKSTLHRNYSSLCSLTLGSLRTLRFNHSNATGIDMKQFLAG
jgi:hypothetical protein